MFGCKTELCTLWLDLDAGNYPLPMYKTAWGRNDFLAENDKNDYNWYVSRPSSLPFSTILAFYHIPICALFNCSCILWIMRSCCTLFKVEDTSSDSSIPIIRDGSKCRGLPDAAGNTDFAASYTGNGTIDDNGYLSFLC